MQVDLLNFLDPQSVVLDLKGKNKKAILTTLVETLVRAGKIGPDHKKDIIKALIHREDMGSTAIGGSIALPHARLESIKHFMVCVGVAKNGVDFDSLDDEPVSIIVLLLSNQKEAGLHLKMLALWARVLRDRYFVQQIREAHTEEEIIALLKKQVAVVK